MQILNRNVKVAVFIMLAMIGSVSLVSSAVQIDTSILREAVTVDGVRSHQAVFQAVADANGGIRASGSNGYNESVDYIAEILTAAGYEVTLQPFETEEESIQWVTTG